MNSLFGPKRGKDGKYAHKYSTRFILGMWVSSLLSVLLLYAAGTAVTNSFAAFQSCSSNSTGLSVHNCGKTGLNVGDIILIGLFVCTAALTVSLCTGAWRATKDRQK